MFLVTIALLFNLFTITDTLNIPVNEVLAAGVITPTVMPTTTTLCNSDLDVPHYEVFYVYGDENRYEELKYLLQYNLVKADELLNLNAMVYNKTLHFNFVTDSNCHVVIHQMKLVNNDIGETVPLNNLKNIIFADIDTDVCGNSNVIVSPLVNPDKSLSLSTIFRRCFRSYGTTLHELVHSNGKVYTGMPHSDGYYHYIGKHDIMSHQKLDEVECPANDNVYYQRLKFINSLLDCFQDTYLSFDDNNNSIPYNMYTSTYLNRDNNIYFMYLVNVTN